jgi:hypothetical protein
MNNPNTYINKNTNIQSLKGKIEASKQNRGRKRKESVCHALQRSCWSWNFIQVTNGPGVAGSFGGSQVTFLDHEEYRMTVIAFSSGHTSPSSPSGHRLLACFLSHWPLPCPLSHLLTSGSTPTTHSPCFPSSLFTFVPLRSFFPVWSEYTHQEH